MRFAPFLGGEGRSPAGNGLRAASGRDGMVRSQSRNSSKGSVAAAVSKWPGSSSTATGSTATGGDTPRRRYETRSFWDELLGMSLGSMAE